MYYLGFAGLDHGWFRLEMFSKRESPIPREASFVYYLGFAGLYRGWFRLDIIKTGAGPSLEGPRSCTM